VDRHVNPALGGIRLADLADREIVVYRSGRVRIDGADLPAPVDAELARLATTPLALPTPTAPLEAPVAAPGPEHWAGIALHVDPLAPAQLVKELVIDGQLAPPVRCDAQQGGGPGSPGPLGVAPDLAGRRFNVALWDVSEPGKPCLVQGLARATSSRNRRTSFPVAIRLAPGHTYRLVAHLAERRASPLTARTGAPVQVLGGLGFTDPAPCTGAAVDAAPHDATQGWLALRYTGAR
jgi:hypothetical protein